MERMKPFTEDFFETLRKLNCATDQMDTRGTHLGYVVNHQHREQDGFPVELAVATSERVANAIDSWTILSRKSPCSFFKSFVCSDLLVGRDGRTLVRFWRDFPLETQVSEEITIDQYLEELEDDWFLQQQLRSLFGSRLTLVFEKREVLCEGEHSPPRIDTPTTGVVGSLVLILSQHNFTGGELVVTHAGFSYTATAKGWNAAVFLASCEHEVRPVTSGMRVALIFKIHSVSSAPRIGVFVDQLQSIAQDETRDGKIGVLLTHGYSLGLLQGDDLREIDRAFFDAVVLRFPKTRLMTVFAHMFVSESCWKALSVKNDVFEVSPAEIDRLCSADPIASSRYVESTIPFIRSYGFGGTEVSRWGVFIGQMDACNACVNMYAALIIDTS